MLIVPQAEDKTFFNGVEPPFTVATVLGVIINYLKHPAATGWKSVFPGTYLLGFGCQEDSDEGFFGLFKQYTKILLQTSAI